MGDSLEVVFAATPPGTFTLVGTSTAEGGDNLANATLAEFEPVTAQGGAMTGGTVPPVLE